MNTEKRSEVEFDESLVPLPAEAEAPDIAANFADALRKINASEARGAEGARRGDEAVKRALLSMIEVADALDRLAIQAPMHSGVPNSNRTSDGIRACQRLMVRALDRNGVRRMNLVNGPLQDSVCTATEAVVRDDLPDETIVEELIPGYLWNDRVLRQAQVVVSRRTRPD